MTDRTSRRALATVVTTTTLLGAAIVAAAAWLPNALTPSDAAAREATVEYGRRLIRETATLLGPDQPDPDRQYTRSRMDCASCHLDTGREPGTLTLRLAASKYPDFSSREGADRDLKARINGCMQRSMNGQPLPRDGVEINAMVAYIESLGAEHALMGASRRAAAEQPDFVEPDRAADVRAGEQVFVERCAVCHGADGSGLRERTDPLDGYVFPPLWGPDSFNTGAGMHRVLTAARFIKAKMPFGDATLTDDEAFDVAAYINSQPRPEMANLDADYPDLRYKPVDSPYPPYADPFPHEQHRLGPFKPIHEYRARQIESGDPQAGRRPGGSR